MSWLLSCDLAEAARMLTVRKHKINTRTSNSSGSNRAGAFRVSTTQNCWNGRIRLDPERNCAWRVARRHAELSKAAGFERPDWRTDEKLDSYVLEDRLRRVECLGNGSVMASQAALMVCGVPRRSFAVVLVAASRGLLGLRGEQNRMGSQRAGTDRHHHKKHNNFCEALHHWIIGCAKRAPGSDSARILPARASSARNR